MKKRITLLFVIGLMALGLVAQDREHMLRLGDMMKPKGFTLPAYVAGQYLTNDGTNLSWGAISLTGYLRANGTVPLTANWAMGAFTLSQATWQGVAVAAAYGGTGQSSYAVGDLLYASGATALSKLADVAVGQVLVSGGVGVAPAWSGSPSVNNITVGQYGVINPASSGYMRISSGIVHSGAAGKSSLYLAEDIFSNTTGATIPVRIIPTYNQTEGAAANTDLLINRTETAVGSGTQKLISAGVGGGSYVERFGVSNKGFEVRSFPRVCTHDTATPLFGITIPAGSTAGGIITYTLNVTDDDGSDDQIEVGTVQFCGLQDEANWHTNISEVSTQALESGSLATTWAIDTATANTLKVTLQANSDLTTPVYTLSYTVTWNNAYTVTTY